MSETPTPPPETPPVGKDKPALLIPDEVWAALGLVALITVSCSALFAPGILLLLPILATPGLLRTLIVTRQARKTGQPLSRGTIVQLFLFSMGMAVIVGICASAAFIAVCFTVGLAGVHATGRLDSPAVEIVSIVAGILAGAGTAYYLFRDIWSKGTVP